MKLGPHLYFWGTPTCSHTLFRKKRLMLKKCSKNNFFFVQGTLSLMNTFLFYIYCWNISSSIHIYFLKSLYLFSILMTWVLASREPLIDSRGLYAAPRPLKIHAFSICGTMLLAALNSDWKKSTSETQFSEHGCKTLIVH